MRWAVETWGKLALVSRSCESEVRLKRIKITLYMNAPMTLFTVCWCKMKDLCGQIFPWVVSFIGKDGSCGGFAWTFMMSYQTQKQNYWIKNI